MSVTGSDICWLTPAIPAMEKRRKEATEWDPVSEKHIAAPGSDSGSLSYSWGSLSVFPNFAHLHSFVVLPRLRTSITAATLAWDSGRILYPLSSLPFQCLNIQPLDWPQPACCPSSQPTSILLGCGLLVQTQGSSSSFLLLLAAFPFSASPFHCDSSQRPALYQGPHSRHTWVGPRDSTAATLGWDPEWATATKD